METWPETILPLPNFNFGVDAQYSNVRSKMDSGRVRQRPRFTEELELADVKFELRKFEYAAFKYFWNNRVNRGNDWFTMHLPLPNGEGLTLTEIRFVADYKATHRAFENWDISTTIEFKAPTELTSEQYDLLVALGQTGTETLPEELEQLENLFPYDWQYDN